MRRYKTSNYWRNEQILGHRARGLTFTQVAMKIGVSRGVVSGVIQQEKVHKEEQRLETSLPLIEHDIRK